MNTPEVEENTNPNYDNKAEDEKPYMKQDPRKTIKEQTANQGEPTKGEIPTALPIMVYVLVCIL